jgi:hypothetical protein
MPSQFDPEQLKARLIKRMLGQVVENRWRGDLVEEFIKICLQGKGWKHCSENWNSWDFERTGDRLKLQVKQAAQLQTWDLDEHKNVVIERKTRDVRFSVAPAKGYYENGVLWRRLPFPQRLAEL